LLATRQWAEVRNVSAKRIFEYAANCLVQNCQVVLHTTSDEERAASLLSVPAAQAIVIPNGVEIPSASVTEREWTPSGRIRLLFISRIDPKKGLEVLFQALRLLNDSTISLEVCGTGDGSYTERVTRLAASLGLSKQIRFSGYLSGEEKARAFMRADLCVLPSHSENFGMVIAESLAHGVPVITSRNTPWANVETERCGLWVENSAEELANAISSLRVCDLAGMGSRGRLWMERSFSWSAVASSMADLYSRLTAST
jgi:glycosyltransferase involved in cell wall biosynthesis